MSNSLPISRAEESRLGAREGAVGPPCLLYPISCRGDSVLPRCLRKGGYQKPALRHELSAVRKGELQIPRLGRESFVASWLGMTKRRKRFHGHKCPCFHLAKLVPVIADVRSRLSFTRSDELTLDCDLLR